MIARRQARGQAGFVLIEVLVALAVLSVGVVTVLGALVSTLELQHETGLRYRAGEVLQDVLAEAARPGAAREGASGTATDTRFRWRLRWQACDEMGAPESGAASRLHRVVVEVEWSTTRGARHLQASQWVCTEVLRGGAR